MRQQAKLAASRAQRKTAPSAPPQEEAEVEEDGAVVVAEDAVVAEEIETIEAEEEMEAEEMPQNLSSGTPMA